MLLVDLKNCPTNSRSQGVKSIYVNKRAEVGQFKQMLKELMHLPEPATVKFCQNSAGEDTLDEQASVADIGLRHLDRLTLQAPVLCAGMKFSGVKSRKMKYNETADDDAYQRSGDEAFDEPPTKINTNINASGVMGKRLSKLFTRASTAIREADLPPLVMQDLARFYLNKEEEKALYDKHMNAVKLDEEEEEKIQTAAEYIESIEQSQDLNVEFVQAFAGDITKHQYYDVFLCKLSGLKNKNLLYKLYVRENHPDSQKKIVFEENLPHVPCFNLNKSTLVMANRENNELTIISFRLVYRLTECYTIIHKKQVVEFQQRRTIVSDVSISSQ